MARLVYLIDDEDVVRDSASLLLRAHGFDVASFASAAAFLATIDPDKPGCVMLDISMPDMDGWEFMDLMETEEYKFTNQSAFFMLTSSVFEDDLNRSKTKKLIRSFYSKPLDAAKVKEIAAAIQ